MVGVNIFILTQINTNLHGKVLCLTSLAPFGPLLYEMRIEIWNIHGQHQIQTLHITLSYKALYVEQELLMVDPSGVREFMTGFYWGSCYSIFCFLYIMLCRLLFVLVLWPLSVLRFTGSDYPFGIFKLFLVQLHMVSNFCFPDRFNWLLKGDTEYSIMPYYQYYTYIAVLWYRGSLKKWRWKLVEIASIIEPMVP